MENSKEFNLKSGAVLIITAAPFGEADELKDALLAEMKDLQVVDAFQKLDLGKMVAGGAQAKDLPAGIFPIMWKAVLGAATDPAVKRALMKCAQRASYDGIKVNAALFDDPDKGTQAREDYYEICTRIVEVNVAPFFKRLFSASREPERSAVGSPA